MKRKQKSLVVCDEAPQVSDRHQMISEAAYYIAEQRGFGVGLELADWLEAERQISVQLGDVGEEDEIAIQQVVAHDDVERVTRI